MILLGNSFRVQSLAVKVFAFCSGSLLALVGVKCAIGSLSLFGIVSYPEILNQGQTMSSVNRFIESSVPFSEKVSVAVKIWVFLFSVASLFISLSSLCAFSLVMLSLWSVLYLILDFCKSLEALWQCLLEDFLFCLNVLMTLWFIGFTTIPVVPSH